LCDIINILIRKYIAKNCGILLKNISINSGEFDTIPLKNMKEQNKISKKSSLVSFTENILFCKIAIPRSIYPK